MSLNNYFIRNHTKILLSYTLYYWQYNILFIQWHKHEFHLIKPSRCLANWGQNTLGSPFKTGLRSRIFGCKSSTVPARRTVHTHTHTHNTGSKLRCQTSTNHATNICEPLRVISVKYSSVLPDDGSHTIETCWSVGEERTNGWHK